MNPLAPVTRIRISLGTLAQRTRGVPYLTSVIGTLIMRVPMPIYEYRRPDGSTFEIQQSFSDDPLKNDPDTGVSVERVLHAPAVHFKGKGFYNTDYGTRNRQRETAAAAESSKDSSAGKDSSGGSSTSDSGSSASTESKPKVEKASKDSTSSKPDAPKSPSPKEK
jgi:putative FmdB family regulatory protein